ncbi:uncharacterized protein K02A2.6-like [Dermacentor silvarum]|uniref:uncharacterized protein K02A2.6-like n=1 Tax=Dermacentor silvarum TaxID=543639 RepID=UPI002100F1FC|nr:uncharacterized protein K02A2.6-like [Dermacentor silvarum]
MDIPDILRSENGPQYSSLEFLQFMSSWGVRHVTSSPHYAQSNGEAERAVQTAKNIIRKSTNVAEVLLAHRATPGLEGYSPAELLMGRKLKTNVPTQPGTLEPKWEYQHQFRQNNAVLPSPPGAARLRFQERRCQAMQGTMTGMVMAIEMDGLVWTC